MQVLCLQMSDAVSVSGVLSTPVCSQHMGFTFAAIDTTIFCHQALSCCLQMSDAVSVSDVLSTSDISMQPAYGLQPPVPFLQPGPPAGLPERDIAQGASPHITHNPVYK